jgi:hypothetical protein
VSVKGLECRACGDDLVHKGAIEAIRDEAAKLRRRLQERAKELSEMRDYVHHLEGLVRYAESQGVKYASEPVEDDGIRARGA